jgi:hypothetical protein
VEEAEFMQVVAVMVVMVEAEVVMKEVVVIMAVGYTQR